MVRVAFLLVGSTAEAEDVVQDSFARVELRWARLDNPGGYLRRCVVNRAHNSLRRRKRDLRVQSFAAEHTSNLDADEMSDALAQLSPRHRTAIVLRYYVGLNEAEMADALDVRRGTIKSTLHRALAQLREAIEQ